MTCLVQNPNDIVRVAGGVITDLKRV